MSVDGSVPRRGSKLARVMSFRSLAGAGSDQKPFGQGSPLSWSVGVAGVGRDGGRVSASFITSTLIHRKGRPVALFFILFFFSGRSGCARGSCLTYSGTRSALRSFMP